LLLLFVFVGLRRLHDFAGASQAVKSGIFLVTLLPIGIWFYSLFLHAEIRALVERTDEDDSHSRLPQVHSALVLAAISLCYLILEALSYGYVK
jgi:hypothetical protein